jgi:Pyridoxamine 5'-phosphate oxidase
MGTVRDALDDDMIEWIGQQRVFFVATAPTSDGHVNVSPKGHDTLKVLDARTVAYLDLTGSGAETIAHTRQNGRITIMLCAFDGPPRIVRLFGHGIAHPKGTGRFDDLAVHFTDLPGARSIIAVELERVQTSCGYSIPLMEYRQERPTLIEWAERRGGDGLSAYWAQRNVESIDGLPALDA